MRGSLDIYAFKKEERLNTHIKAGMIFDGLREDKVLLPGGVLRLYVEDRTSSAATGTCTCNSVSFISWKHNQSLWFTKQGAKCARPLYNYIDKRRGT
jgi:hypothetical protein